MFFVSVPPQYFSTIKGAVPLMVFCACWFRGGGAGQGAGGEVYLTMIFLAVPLAKRAT